MRAVFLPGGREAVVREIEVPRPGDGEVLLAMKAALGLPLDARRDSNSSTPFGGGSPAGWAMRSSTGTVSPEGSAVVGIDVVDSDMSGTEGAPTLCRAGQGQLEAAAEVGHETPVMLWLY